MAHSLLAALALPPPARGLHGTAPPASPSPTGPIRAPGTRPRDELPAPGRPQADTSDAPPRAAPTPDSLRMRGRDPLGSGGLPPNLRPKTDGGGSARNEPTDAEIATARAAFEKGQPKGPEQLAAVVARIGEQQRRDPLVAVLRDGLARVEPFVSDKKLKEGLHKALDDLAKKGLEKGFLKLLELALGRKAGEVKRPGPGVPGSGVKPDEAPGEHIVTKDFELGKTKGREHFAFEGAPLRVRPGQTISLTVQTPARWKANDRRWHETRVEIRTPAGGSAKGATPSRPITKNGATPVTLQAPADPGVYVLRVTTVVGLEPRPAHDFEVAP